jgi:outer membrane protein insertion porin family
MLKSQKGYYLLLSATMLLLLLSGCTGLKSVPEGRHLYSRQIFEIDSVKFLDNPSAAKTELEGLIKQKPNKKLFWMRPALSLYYTIHEPKKKSGFRYWLKYKLGDPPSLIEDINLPNTVDAVVNRLQNRGNFSAKAKFEVISKAKTAEIKFLVSPGKPYRLKEITYLDAKSGIRYDIHKLQPQSILKPGDIYNLSNFEDERKRIDGILKNEGYFYFNADYILFAADTTIGKRQINTMLNLKPEMPIQSYTAFRYNKIYVFDDYSLTEYHPDTVKIGNYYYVSANHKYKPQTVLNAVFIEQDSLYSRANYYTTLQRLMGLGIYKLATAKFVPDPKLPDKIDVNVFLTPVTKISLSTSLDYEVKSDNYTGPGANMKLKNHNIFGGAELLTITLSGFFNFQYSGSTKGQTSYQVDLGASITFPKFVPFRIGKQTVKKFGPTTALNIGIGTYTRVNLYEMRSFNIGMTYNWKATETISHQFSPVQISYTNLVKSSAEFEEWLIENPSIAQSFEEQFILGSSYTFTNNRIYLRNRKHSFYISEGIGTSGNIVSLATTLINGSRPNSEDPYNLFGLAYSQFVQLRNEVRYFYTPNTNNQIASRLIVGLGVPYGNSSTIPYIRQYYVGGTNDVRAFIAGSIGPGTYYIPDTSSNMYINQTGDIKFESSLEYRFGIYKFFKGALFVDAGNIWMTKSDSTTPGTLFKINTFYKQLAIGAGYGFRFDFNYVIIRFDLAVPLRIPYLPEGQNWVIDDMQPFNRQWRKDNVIWNVAIGYPF